MIKKMNNQTTDVKKNELSKKFVGLFLTFIILFCIILTAIPMSLRCFGEKTINTDLKCGLEECEKTMLIVYEGLVDTTTKGTVFVNVILIGEVCFFGYYNDVYKNVYTTSMNKTEDNIYSNNVVIETTLEKFTTNVLLSIQGNICNISIQEFNVAYNLRRLVSFFDITKNT